MAVNDFIQFMGYNLPSEADIVNNFPDGMKYLYDTTIANRSFNPSYHDNVQDTQRVMNDFLNNPELTNYLKNVLSGDLDFQRTLDLQQRQFDFNSAEAQKARDEYRDLSNTSYQRAVADLKAAGLNPALAATTGAGASAYAISGQGQGVGQYSLGSQGASILSAIINGVINLSTTQIKALSSLLSSVLGAGSNVAKAAILA